MISRLDNNPAPRIANKASDAPVREAGNSLQKPIIFDGLKPHKHS
jgi:hypothetical protein